MKKIYKYSKITLLIAALFTLSTCKKNKFLDVNKNPNYPETVDVKLVLPTCEANLGYMVGNQLTIMGGLWAQYWAQDPANGSQYGSYEEYINVGVDNDNLWATLYGVGANLNYIIANADSTEKNYAAIAYILKAYDFQVLTDAFGKIPLSEALKGSGNIAPKYDDESQVYDSLVVWVNAGLKLMDPASTAPAEDLIYPGASMGQWQMFANTLLLKIYLRQSNVRASVAYKGIAALGNAGAVYLTTPSTDDAMLRYTDAINQKYPLYATGVFLGYNTFLASNTCINYINGLNDYRILDFYDGAPATGNYVGIPQGSWKNLSGQVQDANYSRPNSTEIIGPTSSIRLLTTSESYFLQAEAAARGWLTGSADAYYSSGIQASWNSWPNSTAQNGSTLNAYINSDSVDLTKATGFQAKLRLIITQKWVSMCGNQNFEAWTEYRRTKYPDFFIVSQSSILGGNAYPRRLVYPNAEVLNNTNGAKLEPVTTNIWWDVNP